MAEFSRKSKSKHIIENIDTTKVSKQEVYNFYLRWRKQYDPKSKKLDVKKVKKAEIVRELYKLEALQHGTIQMQNVKNFETNFQKAAQKAPTAANIKTLERLQKQADKLLKAGKISKQQAAIFEQTTEEAKARKKASSQQQPRTKRANVHYKGRYAYDYIKKMVDDNYRIDLAQTNKDNIKFSESLEFTNEHAKLLLIISIAIPDANQPGLFACICNDGLINVPHKLLQLWKEVPYTLSSRYDSNGLSIFNQRECNTGTFKCPMNS